MRWVLRAAGAYSLMAAAALVWMGPSAAVQPEWVRGLWYVCALQFAAMGLGYVVAAGDPFRYWPIVLMGLLVKAGTFVGVIWDMQRGALGTKASWFAALDDLIWFAPLGLILLAAHEAMLGRRRTVSHEILRFALRRKTQHGVTLEELSRLSPALLVFLRHTGCPFCREALADLAAHRRAIEDNGARLVLVHMAAEEYGATFFEKYGLGDVARISDPDKGLYRAFGLPRGGLGDLFGPKVWLRAFQAGIMGRHGAGKLVGDAFQMPGAFLLFHGEIVRSYRHQRASDRPDYLGLVTGQNYGAPELREI